MAKKPDPSDSTNTIRICPPPTCKTDADAIAWGLVESPLLAGMTIQAYLPKPIKEAVSDIGPLTLKLQAQMARANKGEFEDAEGLLVAQMHTLNAIFHRLAQRAQYQECMDHFSTFLKLALRAQNQCRATLETLATIKNPPNIALVKQANVAAVQQVNNSNPVETPATDAPQVMDRSPTPHLEYSDGNALDAGTTAAAGTADLSMATVAEIHRPQKRRRQG